jgi:flavin reductase (DIM6/NTAB) family NADH-FMN oxidoreductase RutF
VGVDEFAAFVAGLDYPLFVVTTAHAGERSGCLVGFATQVSIAPPRMLMCISDKNHTHRLAEQVELLAVHVLSPNQQSIASLFGQETGDETDKFAQCRWHPGPQGVPVLEDAARHMVGRVLARVPFGDHLGLVLEPLTVAASDAPVSYTLADADDMEPGHPA